jgi:3-hydroxymyristoyl/3-hydroxydecanoyl-(acyl carrier protein) dehydratase
MVLSTARAIGSAPTGRFAAFSFVDQITQIQGVTRVCGRYTIPANIEYFPASLVAEALGQLAAWVGMSALGFSHRPVAALAGDTKVFSVPKPGDTLELIVDIESCDVESILYRGHALANGCLVLELADTVGSMLDINEFDDPAALAADFAQLTTTGRAVGAFTGVPQPALTDLPVSTPEYLQARLAVPTKADFFADHFPRRPVFPATLLLDAQLRLAARVVATAAGSAAVRLTRITNVKVRAFTAPGALLVLSAQLAPPDSGDLEPYMVKVTAQADGKTIAGAKMYFAPAEGDIA